VDDPEEGSNVPVSLERHPNILDVGSQMSMLPLEKAVEDANKVKRIIATINIFVVGIFINESVVQKLYYNTTPYIYVIYVYTVRSGKIIKTIFVNTPDLTRICIYYLYLYSNTVASTTRTHSVALVVTLRVGYYHLVYLSTYIS